MQARTVASHGGWWLRHVACWNIEWRWTAIIGTDIFQMDILCVRSALLVTDDLNLVGFVLTHASRMLLRCCLNRIGAKVDVQEGSAFVILPRSASPFVTTRPSGDLSRVAAAAENSGIAIWRARSGPACRQGEQASPLRAHPPSSRERWLNTTLDAR